MNIHIYPSTFANESRILKIIRSLRTYGIFSHIRVIALWKEGLVKHEVLDDGIDILRVAPIVGKNFKGKIGRAVKVFGWYLGVLLALRNTKVTCFNCHSLPVLPLSIVIKLWKRCVLVYDPHELETETASLTGKAKLIARQIERFFIRKTNTVCVVNHSIANWYKKHYQLEQVWVVRNVPYRNKSSPTRTGLLRSAVGLSSNAQIFLYQGLLAPGRGIDTLISAFQKLPTDKHLVFMGYGELENKIKEASSTHSNIHFLPAVPPEQVKNYSVDADIGLSLIENVCLSYYLCLPNKLFEYATCGVPTIVSDFPEMGHFIDAYDCGWKAPPNAQALQNIILKITAHELMNKASNTRKASKHYCWQEEEKELIKMYESLGFSKGPASPLISRGKEL